MRKKVLATALCAAVMAITMGFAVVAKTADASLKTEGNFRTYAEATPPIASDSEDEQDEDVADEVTDEVIVTDEAAANEIAVPKAVVMNKVGSPSNAVHVSTEEELRDALRESEKKIVLDDDIQVTEPLEIGTRVNVAIDGSGHSVYRCRQSSSKGRNLAERHGSYEWKWLLDL